MQQVRFIEFSFSCVFIFEYLDETKLPIVNTVFRNLAPVLPNISLNKLAHSCP